MSPSPLAAGDPMADVATGTANVAFDVNASGQKTVIGVNNTSFLSACDKNAQATSYVNCAGDAALVGSGFDDHAASGWLQSTVSVPVFAPGADRVIALRFAIWDSSDAVLDSTAIIDDFQWSTTDGGGATTVVLPPK